ncbi:MAG TPA: anti-sigma factor [Pseudomonas xinjiangensis]|uniref:Anti-sigma factor n=2 Tax=root TaxID=1 RepID=A0A7V1FSR1_9GAMM|nr:anti-sigma factor [Halopseudomonas xinjiangensis]HEC48213.1 anti-sigma factor [Halopseudomonas xinjiangensis]
MNTSISTDDNDDLQLAEYALGVLETEERQVVERALIADPDYARRLAGWQEHLAPMINDISEATPPDYVWTRISDSLGEPPRATKDAREANKPGFWDSLALWRWFSAAGLAAALVMGVMLLTSVPDEIEPQPVLTAALQLESGQTVFTATLDAQRQSLVVVPAGEIDLDGREAELWLIAGDEPPQSLGLLPINAPARLNIPDELLALAQAQSVFAISLEPQGGSPTGLPTGPVIAQGQLVAL